MQPLRICEHQKDRFGSSNSYLKDLMVQLSINDRLMTLHGETFSYF